MKRRTSMFAAATCALALALPVAGASADSENSNAAQAKRCAAAKKADRAAFKALYGEHAMRQCIKTGAPSVDDFLNAAERCREERARDEAAFMAFWGSNSPRGENARGTDRNAFGKCVSFFARQGGQPTA